LQPPVADDVLVLVGVLLAKAEAATADTWRLTGADQFLMVGLAAYLGLTLPSVSLQTAPAAADFLRLGQRTLVDGYGHHDQLLAARQVRQALQFVGLWNPRLQGQLGRLLVEQLESVGLPGAPPKRSARAAMAGWAAITCGDGADLLPKAISEF
jgi:hypothetical protein